MNCVVLCNGWQNTGWRFLFSCFSLYGAAELLQCWLQQSLMHEADMSQLQVSSGVCQHKEQHAAAAHQPTLPPRSRAPAISASSVLCACAGMSLNAAQVPCTSHVPCSSAQRAKICYLS